MPEIKHNFTKGRMNKDLDERLIPNGEYRDAMNVQVSTSEDSEVGTVQNILGNHIVLSQGNGVNQNSIISPNSYCVGSIADEKNDKLYWMVASTAFNIMHLLDTDPLDRVNVIKKDTIVEYDNTNSVITPVIVDIYNISIPLSTGFSASPNPSFPNTLNTIIDTSGISVDMALDGYDINGNIIYSGTVKAINGTDVVLSKNIFSNFFNIEWFVFSRKRTLNFNTSNIITGINIIDDLLFWVDGYYDSNEELQGSEPKKINIPRSIQGTSISGGTHTRLINNEVESALVVQGILPKIYPIEEKHITVIKRAPQNELELELKTGREDNLLYTGTMDVAIPLQPFNSSFTDTSAVQGHYDFSNLEIGDIFYTEIESDINGSTTFGALEWSVGSKVVLKEYDISGGIPQIPITNYAIKGVIVNWIDNYFVGDGAQLAKVAIEIGSIDGIPQVPYGNNATLRYAIDLFDETERLFEFKFPRFSYRYKYEDGEYSTFAPFTQAAFVPGSFDYHPKKGYNLGMTNRLKSVVIKGFMESYTPEDVVEIDLLYKEDGSNNVYIVDTIKPNEEESINSISTGTNSWFQNNYEVTLDTIKATVASNQLLRSWDNVPLAVRAQEVTGNRVVYGNYLQNFDLLTTNIDAVSGYVNYYPRFNHAIETNPDNVRSIKSLREYQIGVVFADKYGRETPVLSNPTGTFKLEKDSASSKNSLRVRLKSTSINESYPVNMDYFKFYIKETSGEYYNMAMDRYYDAEDGNIWLSFPSSDRNKIDIDTFLILKKGVDMDSLVTEPARYKVIAIENEAPDFIKTRKTVISDQTHNSTATSTDIFNQTPIPTEDSKKLKIQWEDVYDNSGIALLHETQGENGILYFELQNLDSTLKSNRYRIANLALTDGNPGTTWTFQFDEAFDERVNQFTNDPQGLNSTLIVDDTRVIFYRDIVENKPEFDGRFFVKIYNDDVFTENIVNASTVTSTTYTPIASKKIYNFQRNAHKLAWKNPPSNANNIINYAITRNGNSSRTWENYVTATTDSCDEFSNIASFNGEDAGMWKPYVSFFRGTNIAKSHWSGHGTSKGPHDWKRRVGKLDITGDDTSNWAFEDVWFVDSDVSAGSFTFDPSFSSGGWNRYPNTTNISGVGIDNTGNNAVIELGFGGIQPQGDLSNTQADPWNWLEDNSGNYTSSSTRDVGMFDLKNNGVYTTETDWLDKLSGGIKIRWAEDPTQTVYEVINIQQFLRVRYDDDPDFRNEKRTATGLTTAYSSNCSCYPNLVGGSDYTTSGFFRPGNYSRNWKMTLDKPLAWNPYTLAGPITNGLAITVQTPNAYSSSNQIELNSLQGTDPNYGQQYLQVGMVLVAYGASTTPTPHWDNDKWLVISEIDTNTNTVKLKKYDVTNGTPNVSIPTITISANDYLTFQQMGFNGLSPNSAKNINYFNNGEGFGDSKAGCDAVGYTLQILEASETEAELPRNPAIWETEPKEFTDLDIYYEAGQAYPTRLNKHSNELYAPIGSFVECKPLSGSNPIPAGTVVAGWNNDRYPDENIIALSNSISLGGPWANAGDKLKLTRLDGSYTTVSLANAPGTASPYGANATYPNSSGYHQYHIDPNLSDQDVGLPWFNCYSFGNGVESNRIRDNFNLPYISNGVIASTTLAEQYKKENRKYGLIYSGIYNSISGINNLNQFIAAEKITKDINPIYGSIQKLHSRDTDLVTLCEDKILKILANKDAVYEADGKPQLIATENVLGQTTPFVGEFGISKDPESFASEAYRAYFTDRQRSAVMRLSQDGLTPISDHGMKDWFRDNLKLYNNSFGSYDDRNNEYNLTLKQGVAAAAKTVSFKEEVKGWTSFKSFTPENAVSCANNYFTISDGMLYKHYNESIDRNTFYGNYTPSSINVILNESPGTVKSFHTLDYEGSQSQIVPMTFYDTGNQFILEDQYYNLTAKDGWYVESAITDLENGSLNEFIEKEGKWFNYFHGKSITTDVNEFVESNYDTDSFAVQGIGYPDGVIQISGCTDPTMFNYDPNAIIDDGSCVPIISGCNDPLAMNYNPLVNTPLISDCEYCVYGCMDPDAINYNPLATCNDPLDPCCLVAGCTDPNYCNYDPLAQCDDGSCDGIPGCTDPTATNYNPAADCDDSSCVFSVIPQLSIPGCMDNTTINGAGLGVHGALNYNPAATVDDGTCIYCVYGCTDPLATNYDPLATCDDNLCQYITTYPSCSLVSNADFSSAILSNTSGEDLGSAMFNSLPLTTGWKSHNFYDDPGNSVGNSIPPYIDANHRLILEGSSMSINSTAEQVGIYQRMPNLNLGQQYILTIEIESVTIGASSGTASEPVLYLGNVSATYSGASGYLFHEPPPPPPPQPVAWNDLFGTQQLIPLVVGTYTFQSVAINNAPYDTEVLSIMLNTYDDSQVKIGNVCLEIGPS